MDSKTKMKLDLVRIFDNALWRYLIYKRGEEEKTKSTKSTESQQQSKLFGKTINIFLNF